MKIIYTDGVFDLFHFGHANLLKQAKELFEDSYLLVGVCKDEDVIPLKGPVVMTYEERCKSVKHCKWVDEVVYDAPWIIDEQFLIDKKIDYVTRDSVEYVTTDIFGNTIADAYSVPKKLNKFIPINRTPNISTTDLVNRILINQEIYKKRNNLII